MSLCKELAFQLILVLESIRFSNDNLVRCLYRHSTTCVPNFLKWVSLLVKEGGKLSSDELKPEVFKLVASALVDITSSTTLDEENPPSDEKADAAEKAFALNPTFLWHSGGAHGAMFHMAMIAYYTLTGTEIKHIEKERVVNVCSAVKTF